MPASTSLSTNDSAVLNALFDSESSTNVPIDPSLPAYPDSLDLSLTPESLESLQKREVDIIRRLQAATTTSVDTVKEAITALDTLIEERPTYPSAYVNRAQARRMLIPDSKLLQSKNMVDNEPASRILNDLAQAISLASPKIPSDRISKTQARVLADAHTHRGYLFLKAARVKREDQMVSTSIPIYESRSEEDAKKTAAVTRSILDLSADQLEEMASRDFAQGGRYGNRVAGSLAVRTNPYAKMCGAIVKEAMRKEIESSRFC
ncbi:hypothetical protein MPDQ_004769 [Monascus purpureus]|uniref:Tetratricopeptide repeat protein 36 n=1 Tax=Monascus purpureus TaxID=5098 RepID=A0A507QZM6_MONPU|nr:hypothetical protein MPDQ_004769 [Monascus purpureus]BDD62869.1 hypothetical protein MAP00_007824 [Monascus purpureus]